MASQENPELNEDSHPRYARLFKLHGLSPLETLPGIQTGSDAPRSYGSFETLLNLDYSDLLTRNITLGAKKGRIVNPACDDKTKALDVVHWAFSLSQNLTQRIPGKRVVRAGYCPKSFQGLYPRAPLEFDVLFVAFALLSVFLY